MPDTSRTAKVMNDFLVLHNGGYTDSIAPNSIYIRFPINVQYQFVLHASPTTTKLSITFDRGIMAPSRIQQPWDVFKSGNVVNILRKR